MRNKKNAKYNHEILLCNHITMKMRKDWRYPVLLRTWKNGSFCITDVSTGCRKLGKLTLSTKISWQIDGETMETVTDSILGGSKITAYGDCSHEIKRCLLLGRKTMTNLDSILKSRDIALPTKVHLVKAMVFFSSHVWMWELDYKESWAPKYWCFWTVVLEKTLESPLDCKIIKSL